MEGADSASIKPRPAPNQIDLEDLIMKMKDYSALSNIRYGDELPSPEYQLGEGSNGQVFLYKLKDGRLVAGKKPNIRLFNQSSSDIKNLKKRLRFVLGEVNMLHDNPHERIIKFIGCFWDHSQFVILLELMSGTVKDKLGTKGLKENEALRYFQQAAEGLKYLHTRKPKAIIHRDIKCSNLLLDAGNNVKLGDFGFAFYLDISSQSVSLASTAPTQFAGTYYYCAPEILLQMMEPQAYSRSTDVWSFACTLVEMLTGKPPFSELSQFEFVQRSSIISTDRLRYSGDLLVPNASAPVRNLLNSMFHDNPKYRPKIAEVLSCAQAIDCTDICESSSNHDVPRRFSSLESLPRFDFDFNRSRETTPTMTTEPKDKIRTRRVDPLGRMAISPSESHVERNRSWHDNWTLRNSAIICSLTAAVVVVVVILIAVGFGWPSVDSIELNISYELTTNNYNEQETINRATDSLKWFYQNGLFSDDFSTSMHKNMSNMWIDVTLLHNDSNTTDYRASVGTSLLDSNILLLEGDAETGKSTLMRKILHDWTNGHFTQFKLAVYCEFRNLRKNKKTLEDLMSDIIEEHIIAPFVKSATNHLLQTGKSHTILLLLDGYDDVTMSICEELRKRLTSEFELPEAKFKTIISARTNYIQSKKGHISRTRVIGFGTKQQKFDYIDKYFHYLEGNNSLNGEKLKNLLNSKRMIMELSENPYSMFVICYAFNRFKERTQLKLYEKVISAKILWHAKKKPSENIFSICSLCNFSYSNVELCRSKRVFDQFQWFPSHECSFLHKLGRLAFTKLFIENESNVEFSELDLKGYGILANNSLESEFLSTAINNGKRSFKFMHTRLQVFFAAFYCYSVATNLVNDNIQWYDSVSLKGNSTEKFLEPSEFEYVLFQYAVKMMKYDYYAFRRLPLFRKYTKLSFSFSMADIETEEQLKMLLVEFVNVTQLKISGLLEQGNIEIPRMENLHVLSFGDILFVHQNQTILPLKMNELVNLKILVYKTCPKNDVWRTTMTEISRSKQILDVLKIHCVRWPVSGSASVANFLSDTVKCSKQVRKLKIFKHSNDNWPLHRNINSSSNMTDVIAFIIQHSDFITVELSKNFVEYYSVNINQFPSAKEKKNGHRNDRYIIDVAEHKANTTLRLNLSRWGILTGDQLSDFLVQFTNLTKLTITGRIREGNLTVPQLHHLRYLSLNADFSYPLFQSINSTSIINQPRLKKVEFLRCPWTLNQWSNMIQIFSSSELDLDALQINCREWSFYKHWSSVAAYLRNLVACKMPIKNLVILNKRNADWKIDLHPSADSDMTAIIKQLAKKKNIGTIILGQNFVTFSEINMAQFSAYNISKNRKLYSYKITSEYKEEDILEMTHVNSTMGNLLNSVDERTELGETFWSSINLINVTHLTSMAELRHSGKAIYRVTAIRKFVISNGQRSNRSLLKRSPASVYESCPWPLATWQTAESLFCDDPNPFKYLKIICPLWSGRTNNYLIFNLLAKLFQCSSSLNAERVFLFNKSENPEKDAETASSNEIKQRKLNEIEHLNLIRSSPSLEFSPIYLFNRYKLLPIRVESNTSSKVTQKSSIFATELYLDISKNYINTGQQLGFHLGKFHGLSSLIVSGDLVEGDLSLPPMPNLQSLKIFDVKFAHTEQKISPLSTSDFPKLKAIDYESCPWSWNEFDDGSQQANLASLFSLCSESRPLERLLIRCSDWSSRHWLFIANFFAEIKNCSGAIDAIYFFKYPEDTWPLFSEKPNYISITDVLMGLNQNANFSRIIVNEEFLTYNKMNISNMLHIKSEKYLGMNIFEFAK